MPTRILLVEDQNDWAKLLTEALGNIRDTEVEQCSWPDKAEELTRKAFYDVYFVDLKLHKDTFEGIRLIEKLRDLARHSVIVAYSGEIPKDGGGPLADECRKVKADAVYSRDVLVQYSSASFEEMIGRLRAAREGLLGERVFTYAHDLDTQAALEAIDERRVRLLLRELLPDSADDDIKALSSGYSGAFVLGVTSHIKKHPPVEAKTVIKISQSRSALDNELRRRPYMGSALGNRAVPSGDHLTKAVEGWNAIMFAQVVDAVPLSTYLKGGTCNRSARTVLSKLVDEVVIGPARQSQLLTGVGDDYRLSWRAGAGLIRVLDEIAAMKAVVSKQDRELARKVRAYAEDLLAGTRSIVGNDARVAWLHGDLHADNVFVSPTAAPVVIDFERAEPYPRLFDAAALHVDLAIVRLDRDGGNDWDMRKVRDWSSVVLSGFPFEGRRRGGAVGADRLSYMIHKLPSELRRALDGVSAEEYASALLFQLARFLKFPTVTVPKRVLGIRMFNSLMQLLAV
jgi:CheY-like chemotaxis protein